jgi:hypothetical protein
MIAWGYYVSRFAWNNMSCAMRCSQKACQGVTSSVSVMAAVTVAVAGLQPVWLQQWSQLLMVGITLATRATVQCRVSQPSFTGRTMFPLPLPRLQSPTTSPVSNVHCFRTSIRRWHKHDRWVFVCAVAANSEMFSSKLCHMVVLNGFRIGEVQQKCCRKELPYTLLVEPHREGSQEVEGGGGHQKSARTH